MTIKEMRWRGNGKDIAEWYQKNASTSPIKITISEVASIIGCARRTVERWNRRLERLNYLSIRQVDENNLEAKHLMNTYQWIEIDTNSKNL